MRPVSTAYRAAIGQSHAAALKIEVLKAGKVMDTLTVAGAKHSATVSGTVTLDARAASRGRFECGLVDDGTLGLVPTTAASLLAPYGNELQVYRGLVLPSGVIETPSIGVFRIDAANIEDTADGLAISLSGLDRSVRVIDARFEEPYEVAAGTNVETAIRKVVEVALPNVVTDFPGVTFVTPQLRAEEGGDRWKFAQDIATACGLELYFDGDGALRLAPASSGDPVATIAEGQGGVLLSAARGWVREGTFNRVIATGENTGEAAPARGVATDDDPASPTYYHGPFGRVPRFFQSQFIATNAQAQAAATAMLKRELGTTQTVRFDTIVDPSLEPGDTIRVTRQRSGIDEENTLDTLTIPLGVEQPMTGATRARQVT